jgi:hypothetical protein
MKGCLQTIKPIFAKNHFWIFFQLYILSYFAVWPVVAVATAIILVMAIKAC